MLVSASVAPDASRGSLEGDELLWVTEVRWRRAWQLHTAGGAYIYDGPRGALLGERSIATHGCVPGSNAPAGSLLAGELVSYTKILFAVKWAFILTMRRLSAPCADNTCRTPSVAAETSLHLMSRGAVATGRLRANVWMEWRPFGLVLKEPCLGLLC